MYFGIFNPQIILVACCCLSFVWPANRFPEGNTFNNPYAGVTYPIIFHITYAFTLLLIFLENVVLFLVTGEARFRKFIGAA